MDAIERIEISLKTKLTEYMTNKYGDPFIHFNQKFYKENFDLASVGSITGAIRNNTRRSFEKFVQHYRTNYSKDEDLPMWMAIELMTFGNLFTMYRQMKKHDKKEISNVFKVPPNVLESWIKSLNYIRNICAHHGRLWNRTLAIRPLIPKPQHQAGWEKPVNIRNSQDKIFAILTIMKYMLTITAPNTNWYKRFQTLLCDYPDIPLHTMGFPKNWRESPLWKE
jgi:abortive infection bacteriophage resistance protein